MNMTSMALAPTMIKMRTSRTLLEWRSILKHSFPCFYKTEVVYHLYLHRKSLLVTFCIFENWRWLINLGLPILGRLTPGRYYQPNQIRDAVRDVTQMMPKLHCIPVGNRIELLEIRFCARRNARRNRNELGNCNFYSNCGDRVVLLPRP